MELFKPVSTSRSKAKKAQKLQLWLAVICAGYAIYVWPNLVAYLVIQHGLPTATADSLLVYMGVIASGPIGLWVWLNRDKE